MWLWKTPKSTGHGRGHFHRYLLRVGCVQDKKNEVASASKKLEKKKN